LPIEAFMVPLTTIVRSRFITARAAARHMIRQHSGVVIPVTGSPARPHVPGAAAIGAAFGAMENLVANLAFEVSPFGVTRRVEPCPHADRNGGQCHRWSCSRLTMST
jgi:NAD(P)-dependent dehydrogenase (short-subunit alcohol dehydrogenase family)